MTWADTATITVEMAIGLGAIEESAAALVLEIETETAGVSSAALGQASIESSWTGLDWFTIEDDPAGEIETGGIFADETVSESDWVDISGSVSGETIRHVKPSRFGAFDARTLSLRLQDDESRTWDPLNLSGPYVVGSTSLLREGARVRVTATVAGVSTRLFTGFVSSWPVTLGTWPSAEVVVECHDWFGLLARGQTAALDVAVGAGETVTARIHRILDAAGVPLVERDIGTSTVTCQSTTLGDNALSMLRAAAASDGGEIWVAPDGRVTFRSWAELWSSDQRNLVQWTLTNTPTGAARECDYDGDPVVSNDLRDTISRAILQRVGGFEQDAVDSGLLLLYGNRAYSRTDLVNSSDAAVLNLAAAIVSTQPTLPVRISAVTVRPDVHPEALAVALGAQLWDRIAVSHSQITDDVLEREALLVGVEHRIEDVRWSTTFTLQDCTGLDVFTVGSSALESTDMFA